MINKENLFTHQSLENAECETSKNTLSNYILKELPTDLCNVRNGDMTYDSLSDKHSAIILNLQAEGIGPQNRDEAAIQQLDLVFMMGSYLPGDNFSDCPDEVIELAREQAGKYQLSPHMDYELVIDVNSKEFERTGNMRTFLDGAQGLAERDFYYGHYLSERQIRNTALQLNSIVMNPRSSDDVRASLLDAATSMKEFKDHMLKYAKLSRDAFGSMRPYLASYPDGTRNASGAFMPSVQLAELMLHSPSVEHQSYISESMPYFPLWARDLMAEWSQLSLGGHNITSLIEDGRLNLDTESIQLVKSMSDDFYKFRTIHLGITKKQIPEAFEGRNVPTSRKQIAKFGEPDIMADGVPGTAGFDIVNILGGSASRLAGLRARLEKHEDTRSGEEKA